MRSRLISALRRLRLQTHTPRLARPLSQHIRRLRWQAPLAALALVLVYQAAQYFWMPRSKELELAVETLLYGVAGPALVWLALGWMQHKAALHEAAESDLVRAHAELTRLNQRISFLLKVNQRLGEAGDEETLAALALQLPGEAVPAVVGCALVRFDDHRQPMPVEYRGALDEAALTEPMAVAVRAVMMNSKVEPGDVVVVQAEVGGEGDDGAGHCQGPMMPSSLWINQSWMLAKRLAVSKRVPRAMPRTESRTK